MKMKKHDIHKYSKFPFTLTIQINTFQEQSQSNLFRSFKSFVERNYAHKQIVLITCANPLLPLTRTKLPIDNTGIVLMCLVFLCDKLGNPIGRISPLLTVVVSVSETETKPVSKVQQFGLHKKTLLPICTQHSSSSFHCRNDLVL